MKPILLTSLVASLLLGPALAHAQKAPGPLIAHWSFDEQGGGGSLVVKDSGPHQLDGQIRAATDATPSIARAPGMKGQALNLPRDPGAWIELGSPAALDLKPPFTIAAWIKPATSADMEILSRKWDSAPGGWRFRFLRNRIALDLGDEKEQVHVSTSDGFPEAGRWAHVAATYDGNHVRLFVNGQPLVAEAANLLPSAVYNQAPVPAFLGCYVGSKTAYPFVGLLDEVMILGKALNADELVALASSQQK